MQRPLTPSTRAISSVLRPSAASLRTVSLRSATTVDEDRVTGHPPAVGFGTRQPPQNPSLSRRKPPWGTPGASVLPRGSGGDLAADRRDVPANDRGEILARDDAELVEDAAQDPRDL